ncbi:ABC transporter substrate-binding protein [Caldimonas brevitalea]|uniref:Probable sugar-binding periplasmic protein n=1 Tax=Caldimonas brevitalea TaxID=413882 RepID=A0A0G3BFR6_9BURK|nr:ABC transporter substrate-binding protein [Caldimonas brevitalea]AKJ26778.1 glucose/mannose transport system substrate-binding protein [Caldimonas brevitalea]
MVPPSLRLPSGRRLLAVLSLFAAQAATAAPPGDAPQALDVLHWWTSVSERRAADHLDARLADVGIQWRDTAIAGGAGMAAAKVMKGRLLSGRPPAVSQLIGEVLRDWADLGLVLELDAVARQGEWAKTLFPVVQAHVTHRGHVVAAPLGVHRINVLFYNRRLFERLKLAPPADWAAAERAAVALQRAGHTPVAWSDEPWQVATVFEAMLLAEGGPQLYQQLLVARDPQAYADAAVGRALERLRWWRSLAPAGGRRAERAWTDAAREVAHDRAGMLIMGDWVKGELLALGSQLGNGFDCLPVPGTAGTHLYSIDTLAMLTGDYAHQAAQERMAAQLFTPTVQLGYNRLKGSVPVRRDIDPHTLDACARDSWQTFARESAPRLPSLAHRMAADEAMKDALMAAVHRYAVDERQSTAATQRRLATLVRALAHKTPVTATP